MTCAPRVRSRGAISSARAPSMPPRLPSQRARGRARAGCQHVQCEGLSPVAPSVSPSHPSHDIRRAVRLSTASCAPSESRGGLRNADRRAAEAARVLSWRRGAARTPTGRKPASRTRPGVACTLETEVPVPCPVVPTNQPTTKFNQPSQPPRVTPLIRRSGSMQRRRWGHHVRGGRMLFSVEIKISTRQSAASCGRPAGGEGACHSARAEASAVGRPPHPPTPARPPACRPARTLLPTARKPRAGEILVPPLRSACAPAATRQLEGRDARRRARELGAKSVVEATLTPGCSREHHARGERHVRRFACDGRAPPCARAAPRGVCVRAGAAQNAGHVR